MTTQEAAITPNAKHKLSIVAILSLVAFSVIAAVDLELANQVTIGARDLVTGSFDWLLTGTVSLVLLLAIGLIFHPLSSRRIGCEDERPIV